MDSGIERVIERAGQGPRPLAGGRAAILYDGWLLGGELFDRAGDRDEPFVFRLGSADIIPGLSTAVAAMRVGERSRFLIPAAQGYGDRGMPPRIPPGADLLFEIELLSFLAPVDDRTVLYKHPLAAAGTIEDMVCLATANSFVHLDGVLAAIVQDIMAHGRSIGEVLAERDMRGDDAAVLIDALDQLVEEGFLAIKAEL